MKLNEDLLKLREANYFRKKFVALICKLRSSGFNQTQAANEIGISRTSFRRFLVKLDLNEGWSDNNPTKRLDPRLIAEMCELRDAGFSRKDARRKLGITKSAFDTRIQRNNIFWPTKRAIPPQFKGGSLEWKYFCRLSQSERVRYRHLRRKDAPILEAFKKIAQERLQQEMSQ